VAPCERLELDVAIDFPHPLVGGQRGQWTVTPETFASELAPARTFGFRHELEALRAKGLIQGGSTSNALLLDERSRETAVADNRQARRWIVLGTWHWRAGG
jgi:UDP-3-O-acyl-N-acetylglucosamine deacetylase